MFHVYWAKLLMMFLPVFAKAQMSSAVGKGDRSLTSNCRPTSTVDYLAKATEKLVKTRLDIYLNSIDFLV